jgi:hypothetical protein
MASFGISSTKILTFAMKVGNGLHVIYTNEYVKHIATPFRDISKDF